MLIKQPWAHSFQHVQWYLSCLCSRRSALLVSFTPGNDSATSSQTHHKGPARQAAHSPAALHAASPRAPQGAEVCVHAVERSLTEADLLTPVKAERGEIYPLGSTGAPAPDLAPARAGRAAGCCPASQHQADEGVISPGCRNHGVAVVCR